MTAFEIISIFIGMLGLLLPWPAWL